MNSVRRTGHRHIHLSERRTHCAIGVSVDVRSCRCSSDAGRGVGGVGGIRRGLNARAQAQVDELHVPLRE